MATVIPCLPVLVLLFLITVEVQVVSYPGSSGHHRYIRIFGFGNSLTDTGNADILPATAGRISTRPPYGETYFGHPSGRASDGRIMIDFLVEELNLPQPLPYLAGKTAADFLNGVNFAVGGATVLDPDFLQRRGFTVSLPVSLVNETNWFKHVVQQLTNNSSVHERHKFLGNSFFFIGEMGINIYFTALMSNRTVDQTASLVPHVVGAIREAITVMVAAGARTVMVTGMPPLGCQPYLVALFPGGANDYDPASGCNARLNGLAKLHNRALKLALLELQVTYYRSRTFAYADVYSPIADIAASPARYGFGETPLAACCGGGGAPYNFNFTMFCGAPGSTTCEDLSKYVSWDGIHFTEAANRFITRAVLG